MLTFSKSFCHFLFSNIEVVDISSMVLLMMKLHDISRNVRLQGIVVVRKVRQDMLQPCRQRCNHCGLEEASTEKGRAGKENLVHDGNYHSQLPVKKTSHRSPLSEPVNWTHSQHLSWTNILMTSSQTFQPSSMSRFSLTTFHQSFGQQLSGCFWKKASLAPEILKNYRPVSNLSFLSKIIDKKSSSNFLNTFENTLSSICLLLALKQLLLKL